MSYSIEISYKNDKHSMLVDKDFHEKYKDIRFWLMKSLSGKFYPMMYLNKKKVFVHRAVMGFPSGLEVDHTALEGHERYLQAAKQYFLL